MPLPTYMEPNYVLSSSTSHVHSLSQAHTHASMHAHHVSHFQPRIRLSLLYIRFIFLYSLLLQNLLVDDSVMDCLMRIAQILPIYTKSTLLWWLVQVIFCRKSKEIYNWRFSWDSMYKTTLVKSSLKYQNDMPYMVKSSLKL